MKEKSRNEITTVSTQQLEQRTENVDSKNVCSQKNIDIVPKKV